MLKILAAMSIIVFSTVFLCLGSSVISETQAPPASAATEIPAATEVAVQPTDIPAPTDTPDPCVHWDEVTADMQGQKVCVRGLITGFSQGRSVGTRYEFSDKPSTFFVFSAKWEVTDPSTGKTIAPGTCVEITDTVRNQGGVPYFDIDQSIAGNQFTGFVFYKDGSVCK
jgi:hypothetical protein